LRPPAIETCSAQSGSAVNSRIRAVMPSAARRLSSGERMSSSGLPSASSRTWMVSAAKSIGGSA
jgi:hypothetical protein